METSLAESQTDSYFPTKWQNGYPKQKYVSDTHIQRRTKTKINHDRRTALERSVKSISLRTDEDLYFGSVYVPPCESRFNTADEMSLFDAEITSMCIAHKYVSLIGDFNARTYNKIGFMDADDFLSPHFKFDVELLEFYNSTDLFNRFSHISRERSSQDIVFNNEGKLLLDTCRTNNLIILNGRCGGDNSKGAFTFRNCSVLDYSIASHDFLKHVHDFNVIDLDPIFSDGHSLICTTFCFNHFLPVCYTEPKEINQAPLRPKWKTEGKAMIRNRYNYPTPPIRDIKEKKHKHEITRP